MIDASTTCYTMAREMPKKCNDVTVITNSTKIISIFTAEESENNLICIGGRY